MAKINPLDDRVVVLPLEHESQTSGGIFLPETDPELSFTWYDAAVLSQKIRRESQKFSSESRFDIPLPTDMDDFC